jgi:formylglycine-generating enzyme required for sulfatase activity
MGKFPVTQAQWLALMGRNPSHFRGNRNPVENVTWHDARAFCQRLSEITSRRYRLPSEAEWEYAARAGNVVAFSCGPKLTLRQANYGEKRKGTTPVGQFRPNAFGLFDMHGNVWEWCEDVWHESYEGAPADGSAWTTSGNADYRVLRGGAWNSGLRRCRSASRDKDNAALRVDDNVGFRIVLDVEEDCDFNSIL